MGQMLPEGATILPTEMSRIVSGMVELSKSKNASASLTVKVNLHVHYDYPKHMKLNGETVVANNAIEEAHVRAGRKPNHKHAPLPTKSHLESLRARLGAPAAAEPPKPALPTSKPASRLRGI